MNLLNSLRKFFLLFICLMFASAANAEWVDISPSLELSKSKTRFDYDKRVVYSTVTITNTSGETIDGEMRLKLIEPSAVVLNHDGFTESTEHYLTLVNTQLLNGESTQLRVEFVASRWSRWRLRFEMAVEKEGFVINAASGDSYNPPSASRYMIDAEFPYIDGSFIVWVKPGTEIKIVEQMASDIGAAIQGKSVDEDKYLLVVSKPRLGMLRMFELKRALEIMPETEMVVIDYLMTMEAGGVDLEPDSSEQYYIQEASIDTAWAFLDANGKSIGGTSKWIGVIDSVLSKAQIDLDVKNLSDCGLVNGKFDLGGCSASIIDLTPSLKLSELGDTGTSHGTAVMGIIAASHNNFRISGIMHDKKVLFVRGGIDEFASLYGNQSALKALIHDGAKIINTSFGNIVPKLYSESEKASYCLYPRGYFADANDQLAVLAQKSSVNNCSKFVQTKDFKDARNLSLSIWDSNGKKYEPITHQTILDGFASEIKASNKFYSDIKLDDKDVLIIDSAGNKNALAAYNSGACSVTETKQNIKDRILCVAALDNPSKHLGGYQLTDFSNYGVAVDIATFGDDIQTTLAVPINIFGIDLSIGKKDGTSFSAPIITGIAGLIWNAYPRLNAAQVKRAIVSGNNRGIAVDFLDNNIPVANALYALKAAKEIDFIENSGNNLIYGSTTFTERYDVLVDIPSDNTWIRITPSQFQVEGNWQGLNCKLTRTGWGDAEFGKENCSVDSQEVLAAFSDPNETYQVVVYEDVNGDAHWNRGEGTYCHPGDTMRLSDLSYFDCELNTGSSSGIFDTILAGNEKSAFTSLNAGKDFVVGDNGFITWSNSLLSGDAVSIYILHDDPSGIGDSGSVDLNVLVDRDWHRFLNSVSNDGYQIFNPDILEGTGDNYKLLLVSDQGDWAVSDGLFTIQPEVMDSGLVAHYKFDGNTEDSSGNGNAGISYGDISYTPGVSGDSADLNGIDAYVEIPSSVSLQQLDQVTVSSWVYVRDPTDKQRVLSHWTSGDNQSNAFLLGWGSNDPVFVVNVEGVQIQAKAENVINEQGWYHLVGRYDGSQVTLTVNGESYPGEIQSGTLEHRSGPMYIGQGGSSTPINNLANGQLDEVRVYNRALSDLEVRELYAIGGVQIGANIEELASKPTKGYSLSSATVGNKLFVFGGFLGGEFNSLEVYDPGSDSWVTESNMPVRLAEATANTINDEIYLVGGRIAGVASPGVRIYNPVSKTWRSAANMAVARRGHTSAVIDGRLYAIGGRDQNGTYLSSVEEYDPGTDIWSTAPSLPSPRAYMTGVVVAGKTYVLGGLDGNSPDNGNPLNEVGVWGQSNNTLRSFEFLL